MLIIGRMTITRREYGVFQLGLLGFLRLILEPLPTQIELPPLLRVTVVALDIRTWPRSI